MAADGGMNTLTPRTHAGRGAGDATCRHPDLLEVLDQLRGAGVSFDLDRSAERFELVIVPPPNAAGEIWLAQWRAWLIVVAVGRYSGHAPARCDLCGAVAMLSIVTPGGTRRGLASAPWPKCRVGPRVEGQAKRLGGCQGRTVIREVDAEGVARRKPPGIPGVTQWIEHNAAAVFDRWLDAVASRTGDLP